MSALGSLVVKLALEYAEYTRGLDKGEQASLAYAKRVQGHFDKMGAGIKSTMAGLAAGIAGAFSVAAFAGMIRNVADTAISVGRLSAVAGTTTTEFQRLAAGARMVGVEHDKLADIFKDTQDKVGDFLANGGGALKDFFDNVAPKVGVTAEQFRRLSGPQALQLYFSSLEKANVSHNELVFYLEAIASDASTLIPLLANNAAGFRAAGDEAERLGSIMSDELIDSSRKLDENMVRINRTFDALKISIGNDVIPALDRLAQEFLDARTAGLTFWESMSAIGLSNPSKGAAAHVKELREQLDRLKTGAWYQKSLFEKVGGQDLIVQLEKELQYWKLREKAAVDATISDDNMDPRDRRAAGSGGAAPAGGPNAAERAAAEKAAAEARRHAAEMSGLLADLSGLTSGFAKQWDLLSEAFASGKFGSGAEAVQRLTDAQAGLLAKQPAVIAAAKAEEDAARDLAKATDERAKALDAWHDARTSALDEMDQQLAAEREHVAAIGLSASAAEQLAAAKLDVAASAHEEYAANLQAASAYAGEFKAAYKQAANDATAHADKLRQLASLKREGAAKSSAAEAAETAAKDWEKLFDQVNQSLTDALMRGFEDGKGFGENFADTLQNIFKTMVLKPIIETGVKGVMGQGASALQGLLGGQMTGGSAASAYNVGLPQMLTGSFSTALDNWGAKYIGTANVSSSFVGPLQPGQTAGMTASGALGAAGGGAAFGGAVGGAVGTATQSKTAGVATGALTGAMYGAMVGGPWGAAIGAVAGGLMGWLGTSKGGSDTPKANAARAEIKSNGWEVDAWNLTEGGVANVSKARQMADSFVQASRLMATVGGLSGMKGGSFHLVDAGVNVAGIGGIQVTSDAGDKEELFLKMIRAQASLSTGNADVKMAMSKLQSADMNRIGEVIAFAKDYRFQRESMAGAQDTRTAQIYDIRGAARGAADVLRQSLIAFRDEAQKLGLDTAGIVTDLRKRALAELGVGLTNVGAEAKGMALEMLKVRENANALRETLEQLGYTSDQATSLINQGITSQQSRMRKTFMDEVADQLMQLTDASAFAAKQLKEEQDARLADAAALGVNATQLATITRLHQEQTKALQEQANAWKISAGGSIKDWLTGQQLSDLSSLDTMGKFTSAQATFTELMNKARGGDQDAVSRITASADVLLAAGRDVYASGTQYAALEQMTRSQVLNLGAKLDLDQFTGAEQRTAANKQIAELQRLVEQVAALIRQNAGIGTATIAELKAVERALLDAQVQTRLEAAA